MKKTQKTPRQVWDDGDKVILNEDVTDDYIVELLLKCGPIWIPKDLPSKRFDCLVDWNRLTGWSWSQSLIHKPQFSEYCDWNKLDGWDWSNLLKEQPRFAEYCDWNKLDGDDWFHLLKHQPHLDRIT